MIESPYPSVTDLIAQQRTRRNLLTSALILTILICFGSVGALMYFVPHIHGAAASAAGLAAFLLMALPVIIWNKPQAGFYILLAGALTCETDPRAVSFRTPTSYVPFMLNLNNVGELYHTSALLPMKFSLGEVVIVVTIVSWIVRTIAKREFEFCVGAFIGWFMAYIVMVAVGFMHGITSGGDITMALWEVRAQALFLAAYLMGANLIKERGHIFSVLWILVVCIGVRAVIGTALYLSAGGSDVNGLIAHDDSLFFNVLFFILFITAIGRVDKRLAIAAGLLTPVALFAALTNQRRAGIACFIVAFLPLLPLLWVILKERRKQVVTFGLTFFFTTAIYLPLAWNASGPWALPARAIRSRSDPNQRVAGSDYYRLAENADLKATRDTAPWFGIGYGKKFLEIYALPQVSTGFLKFLPHNSILWIWMRIGHIGFFCFLMLIASVLIKGPQLLKEARDPLVQTIGVLGLLMLLMLFTFGEYDLAMCNYRTILITGCLLGILGVLPRLDAAARETPSKPKIRV